MARPIKKGLDYFPLDITIMRDMKIRRLNRKYGTTGFVVYITLLCEIYSKGYYVMLDEDFYFSISEDVNIDQEKCIEIIDFMVEINLFDEDLFRLYKLLTSMAIQLKYFTAKSKMNDIALKPYNHLLINAKEEVLRNETGVIPSKTEVKGAKTDISTSKSAQSKEKHSKTNKNKKEETTADTEIMNSSFSAAAANACLLKNMENSNYPDYIGIESIEELLEIAKTKLDRSSPYVTHHISLLNDKKWIESLIELSKFGTVIIKRLPPILADFDAHILSLLKNDVAHPLSHLHVTL